MIRKLYSKIIESPMQWYLRLSLKAKFAFFTSLVLVVICGTLFFFIERILQSSLKNEMQDLAREIATSLEPETSKFIDSDQLQLTSEKLLTDSPQVSRIIVLRKEGDVMKPFLNVETSDLPDNFQRYNAKNVSAMVEHEFKHKAMQYWEFGFPILNNDVLSGFTIVTVNFSQFRTALSGLRKGTLLILLIGLLLMWLSLNVYMEFSMGRPLNEIVKAMDLVRHAHFNARVIPQARDEIGTLAEGFNEMALELGEAHEEVIRQNQILEQRVNEATAELRARNLELFKLQHELRRASRLSTAGQVAAMLAHDLGSPLSSLSGHLQLMLENTTRDSEERNRLEIMFTQVERLSDTIRNFLNHVSGMESHFINCNLNSLLENLLRLTQPVLSERKIHSILKTDPSIPEFSADPNQLQQLFLNLFTNAMDAMERGGELIIKTQTVNGFLQVSVADTGAGISPEHLKNIFKPFYSTKEFGKGTGLGLVICKEIVKVHGGQIRVESEPGKGTKFVILFPKSV